MKLKTLIYSSIAAVCLAAPAAYAQTTLAQWTFETSFTSISGKGGWITNIASEFGSGTASGWHAGTFGAAGSTYSTPAGNGSSKSFSSNGWTNDPSALFPGDFYQFAISTLDFQGISFSFNQVGSGTGPRDFNLQYSTDGITFTTFTSYSLPSSPTTWTAASSNALSAFSFDLSSITAINNQPVVYFRLVDASTNSIGGGTVGTAGSDRVDNVVVLASGGSGPVLVITQPSSVTTYWGDSASFSVLAAGQSPYYYQWFYSASGTAGTYNPLTDGSSGHGAGTIAGSTNASLSLTSLDPSQAGYYEVVVTNGYNGFSSVTSSPAQLMVGIRTPIATSIYNIRTNQTASWYPLDTTNLYTVTGTVTTPINMTAATSQEFFIQDSSGVGISVFVGGGTYLPNQGDSVQVTGPIGQYNGLLELNLSASNPSHSVNFLSSGNPVPAPKYFDFASLTNIAFVETNIEGSLVIVSNVFTQQPQVAGFIGAANINITNLNGQLLNLFVNANAYDVIASPVPPFASSITGIFSQYDSTSPYSSSYELDILQYADLVAGTPPTLPIPLVTDYTAGTLTLSWSDSSFTLQSSTNVAGPYVDVPGAYSPFATNAAMSDVPAQFFRLFHTP